MVLLVYARWLLGNMLERVKASDKARTEWGQALSLAETLALKGSEPYLHDLRVRLLVCLRREDEARPLLATLGRMGYRDPVMVVTLHERGAPVEPLHGGSTPP